MSGKSAFNERVKRIANLFQSVVTASIGVGLLAPLAASLYAPQGPAVPWASAALWIIWAGLAHGFALAILGRMKD